MLINNRIIFKDNTSLIDLSVKLNNYNSGTETIGIVAAQDAIYIGSDLPFNHRYFQVSTANDQASIITVSLWDGSQWNNAVEVIDQTSTTGMTLAQSGIISWTPDRDEVWQYARSTEDISDLSTLKIYDYYWAKFTFSANLKTTTALSYLGHRFSEDADLLAYYPDLLLTTTMSAFQTGKTNWNEQHIAAAEEIVKHLRKKQIIWSVNQILEWQQFTLAGVHKTARNIFAAFGENYKDDRDTAEGDYQKSMNMQVFNVDKNKNARLEKYEKVVYSGLTRR